MRFLSSVAVLCLTLGSLAAQSPRAALIGVVQDPSGAILAGAQVELRNVDTGEARKVLSDFKGEFTIPNLAPGPYEVVISKAGFRSVRQTSIVLQMDQTARLEFRLEVGSVTESVEVTAGAAPLINTENGVVGEVIEELAQ